MLKIIGLLFYLITLEASVDAAAYILPAQEKPPEFKCLEGCYVSAPVNTVIAFNETYYTKDCSKYVCNEDGSTYYESCGVLATPAGCKVFTDDTQQYPKCCPTVVCPLKPKPCVCPLAETAAVTDNERAPQPFGNGVRRPCICPRPIVDPVVDPIKTS